MQSLAKWMRMMCPAAAAAGGGAARCSAASSSAFQPWICGSMAQDKPWSYHKTSRRLPAGRGDRRSCSPPAATAVMMNDSAAAAIGVSPTAAAIMPPASTVYHPPQLSIAPMMDWTDNYFRTLARLMTRCAWLYTEMVVAETIVHQADNLGRFLDFDEFQHPIVLQIGGNDPGNLAKAAQLAGPYGYDEINLNCGCPSEKVVDRGCFGASLMLNPVLVGQAMAAIAESCTVPVTVKCRIGVDNFDSYEELYTFVSTVAAMSPTKHFIIHARKAILKGLSPSENRNIPPLKYEYVYALIRDFPELNFTLNGGVISLPQAQNALQMGAYGVMIGRAAYNSPWSTLGSIDSVIYGEKDPGLTRRQIVEKYAAYADARCGKYGPKRPNIRTLMKPLLHLFHAEQGASTWRRAVDEALSVKKLMTIKSILEETLKVIPDSVLDAAPPPPENLPDPFLYQMGPLPERPVRFESLPKTIAFSNDVLQRTEELEAACS
ncbi:unnamed protein product [Calypogeia fissa]